MAWPSWRLTEARRGLTLNSLVKGSRSVGHHRLRGWWTVVARDCKLPESFGSCEGSRRPHRVASQRRAAARAFADSLLELRGAGGAGGVVHRPTMLCGTTDLDAQICQQVTFSSELFRIRVLPPCVWMPTCVLRTSCNKAYRLPHPLSTGHEVDVIEIRELSFPWLQSSSHNIQPPAAPGIRRGTSFHFLAPPFPRRDSAASSHKYAERRK